MRTDGGNSSCGMFQGRKGEELGVGGGVVLPPLTFFCAFCGNEEGPETKEKKARVEEAVDFFFKISFVSAGLIDFI